LYFVSTFFSFLLKNTSCYQCPLTRSKTLLTATSDASTFNDIEAFAQGYCNNVALARAGILKLFLVQRHLQISAVQCNPINETHQYHIMF